jgi:hypothetical protein
MQVVHFVPPPGRAHARAALSSLAQTLECPGSLQLQELFPETEESEEARWGTACHWCMEQGLTPNAPAVNVGQLAPNGVVIDAEMLDTADVIIDDVIKTLGPHWADHVVIERPVAVPRIHPTDCWGTPDVRAWVPGFKLYVWELKGGHEHVEVFENPQLVGQVAGICDEPHVKAFGRSDQEIDVVMRVVQPRSYHRDGAIREWACKLSDLRGMINRLNMAVEVALEPNPPTKVGRHCLHCTARVPCEANQRAALGIADYMGGITPLNMPPHAVGIELQMLQHFQKILEARVSGLKLQAEVMLRAGQQVPFFGLLPVQGRAKWTKPASDVINLGNLMGVNLKKPDEPVTPNQAIKLGVDASVIKAYSQTPAGVQLEHVPNSTARKIFK